MTNTAKISSLISEQADSQIFLGTSFSPSNAISTFCTNSKLNPSFFGISEVECNVKPKSMAKAVQMEGKLFRTVVPSMAILMSLG